MSSLSRSGSHSSNDDIELRRGPWTAEEDNLLIHYIACHGEGRWNTLAKHSGLRRTGKSCRLRWLNYLKPDLKRENLSPEEQLLILKLHSELGNRWSKIAKYLPGRTDNEIKNYWRTKVEKQAKHLKIDSNSMAFQEVIRYLWIPRLLQKIQRSCKGSSAIPVQESANIRFLSSASATINIPGDGVSKIIESTKALDHHQINSSENCSSRESVDINQVLHISDNSENPFDAISETGYNPFQGYNFDNISFGMEMCSPAPFTETSNFKDISGYGHLGEYSFNDC